MNVYENKNDVIAKLVNITAISLGITNGVFLVNNLPYSWMGSQSTEK